MIRLLLVEDDANLSYIIQGGLEDMIGGYEVLTAKNGKEGLQLWSEHCPDIIVSDIEMPVMDGYEMVKTIRETDPYTCIVFTSARVSPKDVVKGYNIGVNNYIKKPFIVEELDAHIRALLKMKQGTATRNEIETYQIGSSYIFDASHATLNLADGTKESLTEREAKILKMLCMNENEVVKRETILSQLWGVKNDFFASRSLDVFVRRLRKHLSADPQVQIKTIKGVGLSLIVNTK